MKQPKLELKSYLASREARDLADTQELIALGFAPTSRNVRDYIRHKYAFSALHAETLDE